MRLKRKLAHTNDVIRACTCEHDAVTLRVDRRQLQGPDSAAHCVRCCSPQPPRALIPANPLSFYLFPLLSSPPASSPILSRGGSCSPRPSPSTASSGPNTRSPAAAASSACLAPIVVHDAWCACAYPVPASAHALTGWCGLAGQHGGGPRVLWRFLLMRQGGVAPGATAGKEVRHQGLRSAVRGCAR